MAFKVQLLQLEVIQICNEPIGSEYPPGLQARAQTFEMMLGSNPNLERANGNVAPGREYPPSAQCVIIIKQARHRAGTQ